MSDPQNLKSPAEPALSPIEEVEREMAAARKKSADATEQQEFNEPTGWERYTFEAANSKQEVNDEQFKALLNAIRNCVRQLGRIDEEKHLGRIKAELGHIDAAEAEIRAEADELGKGAARHRLYNSLGQRLLALQSDIHTVYDVAADTKVAAPQATPPPIPPQESSGSEVNLAETLANIRAELERPRPETLATVRTAEDELRALRDALDPRAQAAAVASEEKLATPPLPEPEKPSMPAEQIEMPNYMQALFHSSREEFDQTVTNLLSQTPNMPPARQDALRAVAEKIWNGYKPFILDDDGMYLHTQLQVQKNYQDREKQRATPEPMISTAPAATAASSDTVEELPPVDIEAMRRAFKEF